MNSKEEAVKKLVTEYLDKGQANGRTPPTLESVAYQDGVKDGWDAHEAQVKEFKEALKELTKNAPEYFCPGCISEPKGEHCVDCEIIRGEKALEEIKE